MHQHIVLYAVTVIFIMLQNRHNVIGYLSKTILKNVYTSKRYGGTCNLFNKRYISGITNGCNSNRPGDVNGDATTIRSKEYHRATSVISKIMAFSMIPSSAAFASSIVSSSYRSTSLPLSASVTSLKSVASSIVQKRPIDDREYKALKLNNGMSVLLISDPSSSRSAAALDVHVGSFSDPIDIPGLAHFTEHMSFLGTKLFPKEDEYGSFLSSHGGSSNAYTDSEDTVYYFDVNSEFLDESMQRFAEFFISPLFTETATARELNAIDSEHAKNINNDGFRFYQLSKDNSNPEHPISKFPTGNKQTLEAETKAKGINIRQALLDFHSKYYSANQMTLAISGTQSIAQLEKMATKYFEPVPNKKTQDPALQWAGKIVPYNERSSASLLEIVPVGEARRLSLSWPIWIKTAGQKESLLCSKPYSFLSHLLGHEGDGSIRQLLVKNGWSNGVSAAISTDVTDLQTFEVSVDLTEEGFAHRYDVVDIIFGYIDLLKSTAIPSYIFDEVQLLNEVAFNFTEKSDPASYVSSLAADMQVYVDPSLYVVGSSLILQPDRAAFQSYLSYLVPEQVLVEVISKDFKGKTKEKARYYGTEYSNKTNSLVAETKRWGNIKCTDYPTLHLPAVNPFIPTDFTLLSKRTTDIDVLNEHPKLIRNDSRWIVYHKLDRSFNQPKVYAIVLLSASTTVYDEKYVVNAKLFNYCFMDSINEFLYDARLAGLGFELEFTSKGIQLIFSGYNDKLPLFVSRIIQSLKDFKPANNLINYARFKDLIRREFLGWKTLQPYYHCGYFSSLALESLQYEIKDLAIALDKSNVDDLNNFLSTTLSSSYGTSLIMGNVNQTYANAVVEAVNTAFPFKPLPREQRSIRQSVEIPLMTTADSTAASTISSSSSGGRYGGYQLSRVEPNENDDNSASTLYFQLPTRNVHDYILIELLSEAVEQSFYNSLRTQQQLGYIVYSGIKYREGIYALTFTVQSSIITGDEIVNRIEMYLADVGIPSLMNITQEELDSYREGLVVRKLEPDQRLTSQAGRFWGEITSNIFNTPLFDRHEVEVEALNKVTIDQFTSFCRNLLSVDGNARRLLVSTVNTQKVNKIAAASTTTNNVKYLNIVNEVEFRKSNKPIV